MNGIHSGYSPAFAGFNMKKKAAGAIGTVAMLAAVATGCANGNDKTDTPTDSPSVSASAISKPTTDTPKPTTEAPTGKPPSATQFPHPSGTFTIPTHPKDPMPTYTALPIIPIKDKAKLQSVIQDMDAWVNKAREQYGHGLKPTMQVDETTRTMRYARILCGEKDKEYSGSIVLDLTKNKLTSITTTDKTGNQPSLLHQMTLSQQTGSIWYNKDKSGHGNMLLTKANAKNAGLNQQFEKLTKDITALKEALSPYLHV
jgi:hypothetical protein